MSTEPSSKIGRVIPEAKAAQERIRGAAIRSPLVALNAEGPGDIYLKLENLQPVGSFKIRGAANAIRNVPKELLAEGVWTASAGNMAQGTAWVARDLGITCTVVIPPTAPKAKIDAIHRLGAKTIMVPFDEWNEIFFTRKFEGLEGYFVHAFADDDVIAGNATIALEILEDLPEVDAVMVPFGGGGLIAGIAAVMKELSPRTRVYASEVESGAPLAASLAAGRPVDVSYTPTFVDGISGPDLLPEIFDLVKDQIDASIVSSIEEVANTIRLLVERNKVVAEGAGAASVAGALSGEAGGGNIVCVVSGGAIDANTLARILAGEVP